MFRAVKIGEAVLRDRTAISVGVGRYVCARACVGLCALRACVLCVLCVCASERVRVRACACEGGSYSRIVVWNAPLVRPECGAERSCVRVVVQHLRHGT
jgi:hypothetical protein